MGNVVVEMSDLKVSKNAEDTLITFALGSCIALMLYDPKLQIAGMIHYMLPLSKTAPEKAELKPAMFGDTGIPLLFHSMYKQGSKRENLRIIVVGGAQVYNDNGVFEIGKKNYTVLRKLLWKNNLMITTEDVGGNDSRTARINVSDGKVIIRSKGSEYEL